MKKDPSSLMESERTATPSIPLAPSKGLKKTLRPRIHISAQKTFSCNDIVSQSLFLIAGKEKTQEIRLEVVEAPDKGAGEGFILFHFCSHQGIGYKNPQLFLRISFVSSEARGRVATEITRYIPYRELIELLTDHQEAILLAPQILAVLKG